MYIGQTQDIRARWRKHEAGTAADHTRKHKPYGLIHYEEFKTREEAVKREQVDRITQAFLPMKKLEIEKLKEVYEER